MEKIMLSGGAAGADTYFSIKAEEAGFEVYHMSFEGHKVCPDLKGSVIEVDKDTLKIVDAHALIPISKRMNRGEFPYSNEYVNNLLRRNVYILNNAETVISIIQGMDENGVVYGGTGWAIEFCKFHNLMMEGTQFIKKIYCFNQNTEKWVEWNNEDQKWDELSQRPSLKGDEVWAGVGTRDLNDAAKHEIDEILKEKL